jgi:hypothetical protein
VWVGIPIIQTSHVNKRCFYKPTKQNKTKQKQNWMNDWIEYCGLVWFGLVWFGLVWFGLVWFGLVWFGLVWFGLVGMFRLFVFLVFTLL